MKYVYIEAKNDKTPEYQFLAAVLRHYGIKQVTIVPIDGWANLKNMSPKLHQNLLEGDKIAILFDADGAENGGGNEKRMQAIHETLADIGINDVSVFLWPNNQNDGDFETMLENIVRVDLHEIFFSCFHDYEVCVAKQYNTPNRKGKFHTFITAQKGLNKMQRNRIGSGYWLFDAPNLWNLDSDYLQPLKAFLTE